MKFFKKSLVVASFLSVGVIVSPGSQAAMLVHDPVAMARSTAEQARNITQLIAQLRQMEAQVKAMTGDRGMSALLSGQNRAYLPGEWNEAIGLMRSTHSSYSALANAARQIQRNQAILSTADMSRLTPQMQQLVTQTRNLSASQQALGQAAYQQASQRVANLQQLVAAIGGAVDAKASMDLQARIQAEQTMLQNDQSKLQTIAQMGQAQATALTQMQSEVRVQASGDGNFPALNTSIAR